MGRNSQERVTGLTFDERRRKAEAKNPIKLTFDELSAILNVVNKFARGADRKAAFKSYKQSGSVTSAVE